MQLVGLKLKLEKIIINHLQSLENTHRSLIIPQKPFIALFPPPQHSSLSSNPLKRFVSLKKVKKKEKILCIRN